MQTEKRYGVDIAVRRMDDLDRKVIAWAEKKVEAGNTPKVIDFGCGAGGLSTRLAQVGASVIGADICDYSDTFDALRREHGFSKEQLQFTQCGMNDLLSSIDTAQIDVCVMQRVLHYIPYVDAMNLLVEIKNAGAERLYVSVTGIESDIGRDYSGKDTPVENRFCTLRPADAEIFSISQPVCLYTPEEFVLLLQNSGWEVDECWISAFGNIKAVCR